MCHALTTIPLSRQSDFRATRTQSRHARPSWPLQTGSTPMLDRARMLRLRARQAIATNGPLPTLAKSKVSKDLPVKGLPFRHCVETLKVSHLSSVTQQEATRNRRRIQKAGSSCVGPFTGQAIMSHPRCMSVSTSKRRLGVWFW